MRVYDYRCPACGVTEERLVKQANAIQFCIKCDYPGLMTRLPSAARTTFEFADQRRSHEPIGRDADRDA